MFESPQRNDIDAARANQFAMHNRMHDWTYHLGFSEATWNLQSFNFGRGGLENDPERCNAQAGGVTGGPPGFLARDNANQITPAEGMAPITNMYLWQPIPAAFYAPCVDGDYDMSVIAHEYGHAVANRMADGPNANLSGNQAGAMGESWSDLQAIEYLFETGFAPVGGEAPVRGRAVRDRRQAGRDPQLRDEREPAQLLRRRLRLRLQHQPAGLLHGPDAGARRRRDLERYQLRPAAGVHRPLRARERARCRPPACAASKPPRRVPATAAGCSWCSTPGC